MGKYRSLYELQQSGKTRMEDIVAEEGRHE
jgi:hypothetical protein